MTLRRSILILICLATLAGAAALRGDELKISGFWISDVQIINMADGSLTYRTPNGGEVKKALAEIEAVRLVDYPTYEQAMAELEAGNAAKAIPLLQQAAGKSRTPWSRAFIRHALWQAYAAAGRVDDFLSTYLAMVDEGNDAYFLLDPPTQLIAQADQTQRQQAIARIKTALLKANEAVRPLLESLLAKVEEAEEKAAPQPQPEPEPAQTAAPAVVETVAAPPPPTPTTASSVVLPVKIADSQATNLLRAGDFQQAITQTQSDIQQQGNLAVDLYLHGIALLYQAQAGGDDEMLKDAGLSFMRVLVYFPQSDFAGRNLVGGSLLELAFIHEKLGRAEKAQELYDRAAAELDPQADTNLYQRLQTLRPRPPEVKSNN